MTKTNIFLWLLCIIAQLLLRSSSGYRKVIIFPSFASPPIMYALYTEEINRLHPGSRAELFAPYFGLATLLPLRYQIQLLRPRFREVNRKYPNGINVIGISQGGLLARALIETMPNHTVHTLVTIVSPHGGVYGAPILEKFFALKDPDQVFRDNFTLFSYNDGQKEFSISGYWRDPNNLPLYYNFSSFLPKFNNEIRHENFTEYRTNFLKLKKFVMIGGPGDRLLSPWQSCFFANYNSNMAVVKLIRQRAYRHDSLGLKTMYKKHRLRMITINNASHTDMCYSFGVLHKHVLPYLA